MIGNALPSNHRGLLRQSSQRQYRSTKQSQEEPNYPVGQDRVVQTTTRIGQSFFRAMILSAYNERCCITGLSIPSLLVASHIVPWSHDKQDRVNPRNGLLLSALHDKAFDNGILTLNDDMTVRISPKYSGSDDRYFSESIEQLRRATDPSPAESLPRTSRPSLIPQDPHASMRLRSRRAALEASRTQS